MTEELIDLYLLEIEQNSAILLQKVYGANRDQICDIVVRIRGRAQEILKERTRPTQRSFDRADNNQRKERRYRL